MIDLDPTFISNLLNMKIAFGLLSLVLWLGYLIFSITVVGKARVLARTLKTALSGVNIMAAWIHLGIVFFIGLIGVILIAF